VSTTDRDRWLRPTPTLDFDQPAVAAFAREAAGSASDDVARAVRLFRAVRDGPIYDPYTCTVSVATLRASTTLALGRGWCVPKAILLAASCRSLGIPARPGFADVRNHLSTPQLTALMGTDVYAWHGYASILLDGRWVKATPAFNARLCQRFGLLPTDFDGRRDSLLHPVDALGRRHVEYVADRGDFDDTPVEAIKATFDALYPRLVEESWRRWRRHADARDFEHDAGRAPRAAGRAPRAAGRAP
jgi:transglutaminase-like putative cysteine protease